MFLVRKPSQSVVNQFIESQRNLPFTYEEVGATRGPLPDGYNHDHNRVQLGHGRVVFQRAVSALRHWQQFDLGWVRIVPEGVALELGATVAVEARTFGLWSLSAARVVYVMNEIDKSTRFGFAYGTLPDHVERGEERFLIDWSHDDDTVWYDILAFSRPRHPLVRLGGPLARQLQQRFARDSLSQLTRVCKP
jgi:uncharacterized protein (UPF0548 family)